MATVDQQQFEFVGDGLSQSAIDALARLLLDMAERHGTPDPCLETPKASPREESGPANGVLTREGFYTGTDSGARRS